jgi:hypothetical protein
VTFALPLSCADCASACLSTSDATLCGLGSALALHCTSVVCRARAGLPSSLLLLLRLWVQNESNSAVREKTDILPQLPLDLRREVLLASQRVLLTHANFLSVRRLRPLWWFLCGAAVLWCFGVVVSRPCSLRVGVYVPEPGVAAVLTLLALGCVAVLPSTVVTGVGAVLTGAGKPCISARCYHSADHSCRC